MKKIKKHILKSFLKPFTGGMAAFLFIMIIAHFFDFLHTFLRYRPPASMLISYFLLRIPGWITTITPVAVLIAVLISLGALDRNNEITAIKSSGIKPVRVLIPLFMLSILISIAAGTINETLIPVTEPAADILFEEIKQNEPEPNKKERKDIIYMGEKSRLYFIERFHNNTLSGLKITEFISGTTIEKKLIIAEKAIYSGNNLWKLTNGSVRIFKEGTEELLNYDEFDEKAVKLPEVPADFSAPPKEPHRMGLAELADFISRLKRSGMPYRKEKVLFHYKIAFPFSSAIVLILGIPLALQKEIQSTAISFFLALIISFIYWGAVSVARSMGINGVLPPILSAWSANIIFFTAGILLMLKTRII